MSQKKERPGWAGKIVAASKEAVSEQPTEDEKAAVLEAIDTMIRGLQDIRERIKSLPSESEIRRVEDAAGVLERFLDSAKARPGLAAALGIGIEKPKSNPASRISEDFDIPLDEFESLSTSDIQKRLLDDKFTVSALQGIAARLNVRVERGATKRDLVDRIVKLGFANRRGYRILGAPPKDKDGEDDS